MSTKPPYRPAEAFHVGEFLLEELLERGWTTAECAARMGGDPAVDQLTLDLTIAAAQAPSGHAIHEATMARETAEGLERAMGIGAEMWLRLDQAFRNFKAN